MGIVYFDFYLPRVTNKFPAVSSCGYNLPAIYQAVIPIDKKDYVLGEYPWLKADISYHRNMEWCSTLT